MIILGFDPAITEGGWFIFDTEKKIVLDYGSFKYTSKLTQEKRLSNINQVVDDKLNKYNVEQVVIEKQFVDVLSRACGAVEAAIGKYNLTAEKMPPKHWMKVLTSKGKQTKEDIKNYIIENYNDIYEQLDKPNEHIIDACGMVLAYLKKAGIYG